MGGQDMLGRFVRLILLCLFPLFLLSSCSRFTKRSSPMVLVILESFKESDYLCGNNQGFEGHEHLKSICDSLLRFTHVYAPSAMHQSSLSSLLTGKAVREHGVIDNGPQGVAGSEVTLFEKALEKKMRTGLFSGGVPFQRKFGITQGVEFYSDSFHDGDPRVSVPFQETVERALSWIDKEVHSKPFLLVIYVPDLLHLNSGVRHSSQGEPFAEQSASIQGVYSALDQLVGGLKKRRHWDHSDVFFIGLNGPRQSFEPLNPLSGSLLHVPFQMKESSERRSNWGDKKGDLISFARLGEWVGQTLETPLNQTLRLKSMISGGFIEQRYHWSSKLGLSAMPTVGLRGHQYLYVSGDPIKVYDSFSDKGESEALPGDEALKLIDSHNVLQKFEQYFPGICQTKRNAFQCLPEKAEKNEIQNLKRIVALSKSVAQGQSIEEGRLIGELINQEEQGRTYIDWLARRALTTRNWSALFDLGHYEKNNQWKIIAQLNLGEASDAIQAGCLRYLSNKKYSTNDFYKHCENSALRKVYEGLDLLKKNKKPRRSFWNQIKRIKNRRLAEKMNEAMDFINDIDKPFAFDPRMEELIFYLPENHRFLNLINVDST